MLRLDAEVHQWRYVQLKEFFFYLLDFIHSFTLSARINWIERLNLVRDFS